MIIPGFTLRHARTKSHVSSNKATPRKGRVVPTLLTSRFSCCNLDWRFRFGHISSMFRSMARRTRRGTDFVGWESSTTQLTEPFRNVERLRYLFSRFHFLSRHDSKGRNLVLRPLSGFINQLEAGLLVHALQLPPLEARCLVVLTGNHVRVGTFETWVCKSNIAPVQVALGSVARRAFPVKTLLRCGPYHRAPVSVWTKGAFDLDRSPPCGRKQCAIVQLHF